MSAVGVELSEREKREKLFAKAVGVPAFFVGDPSAYLGLLQTAQGAAHGPFRERGTLGKRLELRPCLPSNVWVDVNGQVEEHKAGGSVQFGFNARLMELGELGESEKPRG